MSSRRYEKKAPIRNNDPSFATQFASRRKHYIDHFPTPDLKDPSLRQIASLQRIKHIWKTGDRYYKLAHTYYGKSDAWWVIAQYNKRPTESHVNYGDVIYIPLPLDRAILYMT